MEPLRFQTQDESGNPRLEKFKLDLPMILSLGAAYSGIQDIVFALDVRYFNYSDTAGFKASGFAPDGRLLGLGGGDIMSVAAGMQYRMTDSLYVRGGYTFNQSLFSDSEATIGTLAPIFYQHTWACGASYEVGPKVWLNIAYAYVANASLDGPILTPYGPVPGGTMRTTESAHDLIFGVTMRR